MMSKILYFIAIPLIAIWSFNLPILPGMHDVLVCVGLTAILLGMTKEIVFHWGNLMRNLGNR